MHDVITDFSEIEFTLKKTNCVIILQSFTCWSDKYRTASQVVFIEDKIASEMLGRIFVKCCSFLKLNVIPDRDAVFNIGSSYNANVGNSADRIISINKGDPTIPIHKPNKPCYCGSGRKYKKCCRPTTTL